MKKTKSRFNINKLTLLALMTALVVVFQCIALFVPIGFNVGAFALVPIVIGSAMLGPLAGAWLGFVFGFIVAVSGAAGPYYSLVQPHWLGITATIAVVLLKGTIAGFVSGLVYKLFEKKNSLAAIIAASITCPVINTAIFALACFTFFFPGISASAPGKNILVIVFGSHISWNFFVELGICLVFSTVSERIIRIGQKMRSDKSYI